MPDSFEPETETLPKAQQEIWPLRADARARTRADFRTTC
jgi:hypothetical protein